MFFQFSILSTIDNAPREHLIENKARFSLFLVFNYKHLGHFDKGGHYFRKHTLRNLDRHFLCWLGIWIYVTIFLAVKKKRFISALLFFSTCLENHFTVFAAALQSLYVLRGNIYSTCIFPFSAWFAFNWFFRSSTPFLPVKRFFRLTGNPRPTCPTHLRHRIFLEYSHCHHRNHLYNPHIQSHYPESSPQGLASN